MTPEQLEKAGKEVAAGLGSVENSDAKYLIRRAWNSLVNVHHQQAAEIARLTKLNADLSAGDVKEVCELREEVERKDEEISRLREELRQSIESSMADDLEITLLRTAIVETKRQLGEIVVTEGEDAGVILKSWESPTHQEFYASEQRSFPVYDNEYFSELGEALVNLAAHVRTVLGETP